MTGGGGGWLVKDTFVEIVAQNYSDQTMIAFSMF